MGLVSLAVLALTAGCIVRSEPAPGPAAEPQAPPTITVTGIGEAIGLPDIAVIQLGVNVVNADVGEAVASANQTIEDVKRAVVRLGVAEQDVQTTNFTVWPEDVYDPQTGLLSGERRYHADSTLQITMRDVSKAGEVIRAGLDSGANNVYGLTFSIDDTTALESEARGEAISDASGRAQQLAEKLGVTLGSPIAVGETLGGGGGIFTGFERAVGGGGGAPVSPGQLTVTVTVNVTYEIVK